jgi:hypothetical protein
MQGKLKALEAADRAQAPQAMMRQICRKTVRTAFSLVMPRLGCWTTDLGLSSRHFCQCHPDRRADMDLVLDWTRRPPEDRTEFLNTVVPLAEWLAAEFERVIGSY